MKPFSDCARGLRPLKIVRQASHWPTSWCDPLCKELPGLAASVSCVLPCKHLQLAAFTNSAVKGFHLNNTHIKTQRLISLLMFSLWGSSSTLLMYFENRLNIPQPRHYTLEPLTIMARLSSVLSHLMSDLQITSNFGLSIFLIIPSSINLDNGEYTVFLLYD
jgi:hypothetical protein